jgi:hypothetical protein
MRLESVASDGRERSAAVLYHLIYYSKTVPGIGFDVIGPMLQLAAERNEQEGVSGFICFSSKYFLQVLEGSRHSVNQTFNRICRDPRHTETVILDAREIASRNFGSFGLGYMSGVHEKRDIYFKYCGGTLFEPHRLTSVSALSMLIDCARYSESKAHAGRSEVSCVADDAGAPELKSA